MTVSGFGSNLLCENCARSGILLTLREVSTRQGLACGLYCVSCWNSGLCGPKTDAAARRMVIEHKRHRRTCTARR